MNRSDLAHRIPRVVARWSPGLHQEHLREILGADRAELMTGLMIAYGRKQIDFCRAYVVLPSPPRAGTA